MIVTVSIIYLYVIKFSDYYEENSFLKNRLNFEITLFVVSILLLRARGNLLTMILGWDFLGLTSFLLIMFYNSKKRVYSSFLTLVFNRLGDIFLMICIVFLIGSINDFSRTYLFPVTLGFRLILVLAACTKRAQVPFNSWLSAAIAAPTPVRALVHRRTLVTAGVFLLIQTCQGNLLSPRAGHFLRFLAITTLVYRAIMSSVRFDIKEIVAFSTIKHLRLMILSLSLNQYIIAFVHLIFHAFIKSNLFILRGVMIKENFGVQDLRVIGGLPLSRFENVSLISGILSLISVPCLRAYISKHII